MKQLVLMALVLTVVPAFGAQASTEQTLFTFSSEPGDFVGGGQDFYGSEPEFTLTPTILGDQSIRFAIANDDPDPSTHIHYTAWFSPPYGEQLAVGYYTEATRSPFNSIGPGLSIYGQHRGCNRVAGRFEILELEYDAGGDLVRFAADFEQHCEGRDPALFGAIRYRSSVPLPSTMAVDSDTTLTADHKGNIVVTDDNVTLDCAGHSVSGIGLDPVGIRVDGLSGVVVKNCRVSLFELGIFYSGGSTDGTVENNVTFDNTSQGIALNSSDHISVIGNETYGNSIAGIGLANADDGNVIAGNWAHDNPRAGIDLYFADDNLVADNVLVGNGDFGVLLNQAVGNTLERNSSSGDGWGYFLEGADDNVLGANSAQDSLIDGFHVARGANGNTLVDNVSSRNDHGYSLVDASGNLLQGNEAEDNAGFGFVSWGADLNEFRGNEANNNGSDGIHLGRAERDGVVDPSSGNTIVGNSVSGNPTGISTYQAVDTMITDNEARDNLYWGFNQAESVGTTISGNRALKNGSGYLFWSSSSQVASSNQAVNNDYYGYLVAGGSSLITLQENTAVGNGDRGFFVNDASDITIVGNRSAGHNAEGAFGSGYSLVNSTRVTLEANVALENYHGFRVEWSDENTFVGNEASYNVVGFDIVDSHDNLLDSNTASRNGDRSGFELRDGSSRNMLSNNTASHNSSFAGFAVWHGFDNVLVGNIATKNKIGFAVWEPSTDNVFDSNYGRNAWLDGMDRSGEGSNTWTENDFKWVDGDGGWR